MRTKPTRHDAVELFLVLVVVCYFGWSLVALALGL